MRGESGVWRRWRRPAAVWRGWRTASRGTTAVCAAPDLSLRPSRRGRGMCMNARALRTRARREAFPGRMARAKGGTHRATAAGDGAGPLEDVVTVREGRDSALGRHHERHQLRLEPAARSEKTEHGKKGRERWVRRRGAGTQGGWGRRPARRNEKRARQEGPSQMWTGLQKKVHPSFERVPPRTAC